MHKIIEKAENTNGKRIWCLNIIREFETAILTFTNKKAANDVKAILDANSPTLTVLRQKGYK